VVVVLLVVAAVVVEIDVKVVKTYTNNSHTKFAGFKTM
jgi:hypothetical protein